MVPAPVGHQCPTCVGEARREFAAGPGRRIAIANAKRVSVTNVLVAIIVGVFVIEVFQSGVGGLIDGPNARTLIDLGAENPVLVASGETWRMFTAMFLHIGLIHLAVNAYSLYILGNVLEREVGRVRFLALYLLSGLFASAASYYFSPLNSVSAGASGAIFGIFGAVFAINYRRRHTAQGAMAMRAMAQIIVLNVVINVVLSQLPRLASSRRRRDRRDGHGVRLRRAGPGVEAALDLDRGMRRGRPGHRRDRGGAHRSDPHRDGRGPGHRVLSRYAGSAMPNR